MAPRRPDRPGPTDGSLLGRAGPQPAARVERGGGKDAGRAWGVCAGDGEKIQGRAGRRGAPARPRLLLLRGAPSLAAARGAGQLVDAQ